MAATGNEPPPIDPPEPDGLLVRGAGQWTLDKLEIIRHYLFHFGKACHSKADNFYFVDGFSGPGVNIIKDTGEFVWGSPMLALKSEPYRFTKAVLLEYGKKNAAALKKRTELFGDRAVVLQGDTNVELVPAMERELAPYNPCLCLLDPEGGELAWETVKAVSQFGTAQRKGRRPELLILFADRGLVRMLFQKKRVETWAFTGFTRVFGCDDWIDIYNDRINDSITSAEYIDSFLQLYMDRLKNVLGYSSVFPRLIRRDGFTGQPMYSLVFATDHPAGEKIMDSIFRKIMARRISTQPSSPQGTLFD